MDFSASEMSNRVAHVERRGGREEAESNFVDNGNCLFACKGFNYFLSGDIDYLQPLATPFNFLQSFENSCSNLLHFVGV